MLMFEEEAALAADIVVGKFSLGVLIIEKTLQAGQEINPLLMA
jgi:hypothetical protein